MARRVGVGLALLAVVGAGVVAAGCGGSSPKVPLFIFAGQSNMLGSGARVSQLSAGAAKADRRIQYWNDRDRVWTAEIPSDAQGSVGPDVSALHLLASRLGGTVAAVKVAVSGASLVHDWDPARGDGLYASMRNEVSDALLTAVPGRGKPQVAGFFWMQGETDGQDPNTSAIYDRNLRTFIERVRTDLGNSQLPFVLGRVRFSEPHAVVVRLAQDDAGKTLPKVETIDTDDLALVDGLHYDTKSIEALGRRMAGAYLAAR